MFIAPDHFSGTTTASRPKPSVAAATTAAATTTASTGDLSAMAGAAKVGRNRAVDAYRAIAMLAVALGHWLVMVAYRSDSGEMVGANALESAPSLRPITWVFQVMPLFFVVGGFASAMSLDSRGMGRRSTPAQRADWIGGRLARLLPPVAVLGAAWLVTLLAGNLLGFGSLVAAGVGAAVIPLWFLANYTADVVLAPHVLPLFRRSPKGVAIVGGAIFLALEIARLNGEHTISHINWILGWFLFQVFGFAWADGLLPRGRALLGWAAGLWVTAIAMVTVGPWSVSMVHFPGIDDSPTHPPTLALLVFGLAQSATAIAFAPALTSLLERNRRLWTGVVAANSMAMTVYLWHMTAAVIVIGVFDRLGLLSSAAPGTSGWWWAKLPFTVAAVALMVPVTAKLAVVERNALLAKRAGWSGAPATMIGLAIGVSFALKGLSAGQPLIIVGFAIVIAVSMWLNRALASTTTPTSKPA